MKIHASEKWFRSCFKHIEQGLYLGHKSISLSKSSFWHPLMSQYLAGIRFHNSIFNIQKTQKALLRAFYIIALIFKQNGHIVIINTNPEFSKLSTNFSVFMQGHRNIKLSDLKKTLSVRNGILPVVSKYPILKKDVQSLYSLEKQSKKTLAYPKTKISYTSLKKTSLNERISYGNFKWVGGTLTNWKQISKSVVTFAKFSERCEDFCLKNNLDFPRYKKIKKCFQGFLSNRDKKMVLAFQEKPDLVFLVNPYENQNIINEASRLNIPVLAFTQSHTNIKAISYPIPLNNYSMNFFYFCLKKITKMSQLF